jgi:hypothetical protein
MTDLEILVKEFFNEYERANAEFDAQRIAECVAGDGVVSIWKRAVRSGSDQGPISRAKSSLED